MTRPRWKHVREWASRSTLNGGLDMIERALLSLTTAWSFADEISVEALGRRDPEDLIAVLETLKKEITPLIDAERPERMAEELLVGLIRGAVPPEFCEVNLLAATGWNWQALQETPADVVKKMAIYLGVRQARDTEARFEPQHTEEVRHGR